MHCNIEELALNPSNYWAYCPSVPAAIAFAILFGIAATTHIIQLYYHRAWTATIVVVAGAIETCALVLRVFASRSLDSGGTFKAQYVLILVAPLWINAFVFTLLGRLVDLGLPGAKVFSIPANRIARLFVSLDILTFTIQMTGAVITTIQSSKMVSTGFHVYTAGVVLQQSFLLTFMVLTILFDLKTRSLPAGVELSGIKNVLRMIYLSLGLITLRTVFRIVEFSGGATSQVSQNISKHETYLYVLDLAPMLFVLFAFNFAHPAHYLRKILAAQAGSQTRPIEELQSDEIRLVAVR